MSGNLGRRVAALAVAAVLGVALAPAIGQQSATARDSRTADAKLVDAVPTPKLGWYDCYETAQCATVKVPLDYDQPKGAKTELAILKSPARNQKAKLGTLFVNPGGPGGSATEFVLSSAYLLSPAVSDRFDVVGIDPRGIAYSDNVRCFANEGQQSQALSGYASAFPLGAKAEKAWIKSDKALGQACRSNALSTSMSTAEVARDMELMRRAVGDKQLSYLGFSYGTYLGQVYANMFPDRFRAVVVDGVLDPAAWAGTKANQGQPLEARLNSSGGAWKALREILVRCDKAGGAKCSFAPGDPVANLDTIMKRLKTHPVEIPDEDEPGLSPTITYDQVVGAMLGALYDPEGYQSVIDLLSSLWVLTEPPSDRAQTTSRRRAVAQQTLIEVLKNTKADRPTRGFPYDNATEAFSSVTCTDSTETTSSANYPAYAARQDEVSPYFGRAWMWSTSVCAGDSWRGQDDDAYTGPFNAQTKAPVLYVGNYYDPATNYAGAVSAAKRMPNSALVRSDSWGHTAYGTSACVTQAVDAYLLKGTRPSASVVCRGDIQPFEQSSSAELARNRSRMQAFNAKMPKTKHGFR